MRFRAACAFAALLALARTADAQEIKPFNLALLPQAQVFDPTHAIHGVRLGLWSSNANVQGIDVGIMNTTTGHLTGFQWGFLGMAKGDFGGWQANSVYNDFDGVGHGLQSGIINSGENMTGVQLGFVNAGQAAHGLQVAIVNYAESLHGLQLGLVCIANNAGGHPILPIVNWSFEEDR
jgi:hypothetical protein